VFRVTGHGRHAFVGRSIRLVQAVAASGPGCGMAGFVTARCPGSIRPASKWTSGLPVSGSWSTLALAAGLGVPVVVFWCADWPQELPAWPGGSWARAGRDGVWAGGWKWNRFQ